MFTFTLPERFQIFLPSNDITLVWWNCYPWYNISMSFKKIYLLLISNISISTKYMYSPTYLSSQLSWCQIYLRSSPTHQHCFNSFSSYRTPIDMKPVGLIPKFHKLISVQKHSTLSSTYSRSYARNLGAIRNCKLCWPSYLH
jgi:hypothetical protein